MGSCNSGRPSSGPASNTSKCESNNSNRGSVVALEGNRSNESCVVTLKLSIRPLNIKSTPRRPIQQGTPPVNAAVMDGANCAGVSNNAPRRKMCLGKVTRNPFFNFMREFRAQHSGVSQKEMIALGAREWNCLDPQQKEKFQKMAKAARAKEEARRKRKRSDSRHCRKRRRSNSCKKF